MVTFYNIQISLNVINPPKKTPARNQLAAQVYQSPCVMPVVNPSVAKER